MVSEYEQLRQEFEKKLKELQQRCKHKETFWAREQWALAHGTGYAVEVCKNCNKQLRRVTLEEAYRKGYLG